MVYLLESQIVRENAIQHILVTKLDGRRWYRKAQFELFVEFMKSFDKKLESYNCIGIWYHMFMSPTIIEIVDGVTFGQAAVKDSATLINIVSCLGLELLYNMLSVYYVTPFEFACVDETLLERIVEWCIKNNIVYCEQLYLNMLNIRTIVKSHNSDMVCSRLFGLSKVLMFYSDIHMLVEGYVDKNKMDDEYHIQSIVMCTTSDQFLKYVNILFKAKEKRGLFEDWYNLTKLYIKYKKESHSGSGV